MMQGSQQPYLNGHKIWLPLKVQREKKEKIKGKTHTNNVYTNTGEKEKRTEQMFHHLCIHGIDCYSSPQSFSTQLFFWIFVPVDLVDLGNI